MQTDHEDSREAFEAAAAKLYLTPALDLIRPVWQAALDWRDSQVCEWKYDEAHGKWDSNCGEAWQFMDGDPDENNVRFCHGCGRRVKIQTTNH